MSSIMLTDSTVARTRQTTNKMFLDITDLSMMGLSKGFHYSLRITGQNTVTWSLPGSLGDIELNPAKLLG